MYEGRFVFLLFNQKKVALIPKNIFNKKTSMKKNFSQRKTVFECKKIFETQKIAFEHFFFD